MYADSNQDNAICFDFCKYMYIDNVNILRPKWIPGNEILHKQKKNAIACDVVINYMKNSTLIIHVIIIKYM